MKLQNWFSDFLPMNYREFRVGINKLNSDPAVVAELLRICCEEENVKAIELAFERILGKPEKTIIIKRTVLKTIYPDARTKQLKPPAEAINHDETQVAAPTVTSVVIDESNAPGLLLKRMVEDLGEKPREYSYEVLDDKDSYSVAEVMAANLRGIAMAGGNLSAIKLLFEYLDGSIADVIKLEGEDTILLENYAETAPFDAKQDEKGVWYVEKVSVE